MLKDVSVPFRYERILYNNTKINYGPMYAVDLQLQLIHSLFNCKENSFISF